ncbi:MAG TPA: FAD-dependent oxidoreductase [Cryptosporangiaceae bacterium]|nr:FAD-dependent oxidoreductase [Cryptosporangiaceae bacterium]
MPEEPTFVIVGAGLAGAKAAETLRDEGFTGRVVLVGEESERPYDRPPLSKGYLQGEQSRADTYLHDESWYDDHDVELRLGLRATALDTAAHTVRLATDQELGYDKLLLATGSVPRALSVPGADVPGRVVLLRRLDDSDRIRETFREGVRMVIVGTGWIGLEVAAAARAAGVEVTVVGPEPLPLYRVLGDEVGPIFAEVHEAHGVQFRFGVLPTRVGPDTVTLDDGTELPADVVVAGIGAAPATALAESGGLAVHEGILVDSALRTSDPDVYAAGDVADIDHALFGGRVRVEHWATALASGPAAARSMLGQDVRYDEMAFFYSDQHHTAPAIGLEYSGYVPPDGYDQVVFRGDPTVRADADPEFIAFWVKENRVLAGMNVNVWDVAEPIQGLVRAGYAGRPVDLARLADPEVPLGDLLG